MFFNHLDGRLNLAQALVFYSFASFSQPTVRLIQHGSFPGQNLLLAAFSLSQALQLPQQLHFFFDLLCPKRFDLVNFFGHHSIVELQGINPRLLIPNILLQTDFL